MESVTREYEEAVRLLTSSEKFKISLGLDRIGKVLELIGNPQDDLKFIHVAGTNGKGSVCSTLASILQSAGKNVGLYTSPHVFKYNERICINYSSISDTDFSNYVFEVSQIADNNGISLTEFEILTAVMFKYFSDNKVDIVVLETGLGGRYDATNIIKSNLCSVITHIDYDHTDRLGDTLEAIAFEKAGIIKSNSPCIVSEDFECFHKNGAHVILANEDIDKIYIENFALKGEYQSRNLATVLTVIKEIFPEINKDIIIDGLRTVQHPYRFQYIKEKNLIIDGAHNPNGIEDLIKSLKINFPNEKKSIIFGCLNNKDYKKMVSIITSNADEIKLSELFFYHFNHQNSATFEQLSAVSEFPVNRLCSAEQIDFDNGNLKIICGSLYMISDVLKMLNIKCD